MNTVMATSTPSPREPKFTYSVMLTEHEASQLYRLAAAGHRSRAATIRDLIVTAAMQLPPPEAVTAA